MIKYDNDSSGISITQPNYRMVSGMDLRCSYNQTVKKLITLVVRPFSYIGIRTPAHYADGNQGTWSRRPRGIRNAAGNPYNPPYRAGFFLLPELGSFSHRWPLTKPGLQTCRSQLGSTCYLALRVGAGMWNWKRGGEGYQIKIKIRKRFLHPPNNNVDHQGRILSRIHRSPTLNWIWDTWQCQFTRVKSMGYTLEPIATPHRRILSHPVRRPVPRIRVRLVFPQPCGALLIMSWVFNLKTV